MQMLQSNYPKRSISVKLSSIYTHEAKYFKNKHLWGVRMLHSVWEPENMLEKEVSIISHWTGKYAKKQNFQDSKFALCFIFLHFINLAIY